MADVKMSEMTVDSSVAGTEKILVLDGTTSKTMAASVLAAYVVDTLLAADAATPTTGDKIVCERSGTEKLETLDAVSSYAVGLAFDSSVITTLATADLVLVEQAAGGARKVITAANVATYVLSGATAVSTTMRADALNISALGSATLADTDQYLVVQSSTPKKALWSAIAARAHSQFSTYLAALDAVTVVGAADKFYTTQSGTAKYVTPAELATYMGTALTSLIVAAVFDGASGDPVLGTDTLAIERSAVLKSVTATQLSTYVVSVLAAGTPLASVVDAYKFTCFDGSTLKTATADVLATYMATEIFADATVTASALGTDAVLANRSGAITLTVDVLKTYILNGIQATVLDIDGLAAATLADAQYFFVQDAATPKQQTLANLAAYVHGKHAAYVGAQADGAPLVGTDYLMIDRSNATKKILASDVGTYMNTFVWTQTSGTTVAAGDQFLTYRSGTGYRLVTGTMISTYMASALASTLLDLSTLGTGTIADGDYILICQTTTPKKLTASALATYTWAEDVAAIQALAAKTTPVVADKLMILDSAATFAPKLLTLENFLNTMAASKWRTIATADYTALPNTTSKILMSDTSAMEVGLPLRYTYSGTAYYGIVDVIVSNTSVTIRGAALNTGVALTELCVGLPSQAQTVRLKIEDSYLLPWHVPDAAGTEANLLSEIGRQYFAWRGGPARLVAVAVTQGTADGAAQPKFNITIEGDSVLTEGSGAGIQVSGTPGTWTWNSPVAIDTTKYEIESGDDLDVLCTASGSDGAADSLSIDLVFVYE